MKKRIREAGKTEERLGLAVVAAILTAVILVSGFLINSILNQQSTTPTQTDSTILEPKAAIIDQLSLTYPNQTFIQNTTGTLKQGGYSVDYYPGEEVTVEFFGKLPTHRYKIIVLRVHSTATGAGETEGPATLFTSEGYDKTKYVYEQLADQLVGVSYTLEEGEKGVRYFGIFPRFISQKMNGNFQNTTIIMMGCEGLRNTIMAQAFIEKGARVYIGWSGSVSVSHTDSAATHLLEHLLVEKQTVDQALKETFLEVGSDPAYGSLLIYYPIEAKDVTIQNIVGTLIISTMEFSTKSSRKPKIDARFSSTE